MEAEQNDTIIESYLQQFLQQQQQQQQHIPHAHTSSFPSSHSVWPPFPTPSADPSAAEYMHSSHLGQMLTSPAGTLDSTVLDADDDDLLLTPLISPIMAPSPANLDGFLPLTSPALASKGPSFHSQDGVDMAHNPGSKAKRRFPPSSRRSKSSQYSNYKVSDFMQLSPMMSPMLASLSNMSLPNKAEIAPLTPSALMNIHSDAKDMVSPSLKPVIPVGCTRLGDSELKKLTERSNYQNLASGDSEALGLRYDRELTMGMEVRRTNHKAAEQRRRDSIKRCFDEIRNVLPNIDEKTPSKLCILQKTYEYLIQIQRSEHELQQEVAMLRKQLQDNCRTEE